MGSKQTQFWGENFSKQAENLEVAKELAFCAEVKAWILAWKEYFGKSKSTG